MYFVQTFILVSGLGSILAMLKKTQLFKLLTVEFLPDHKYNPIYLNCFGLTDRYLKTS